MGKKLVGFRASQDDLDRINKVKSYLQSECKVEVNDSDAIRWALVMIEDWILSIEAIPDID